MTQSIFIGDNGGVAGPKFMYLFIYLFKSERKENMFVFNVS